MRDILCSLPIVIYGLLIKLIALKFLFEFAKLNQFIL